MALCTTTGGSGGSRMSRRLDANEALPEAAGPPARDILGGSGAPEGEEGRAGGWPGAAGLGPSPVGGWRAAPSRPQAGTLAATGGVTREGEAESERVREIGGRFGGRGRVG